MSAGCMVPWPASNTGDRPGSPRMTMADPPPSPPTGTKPGAYKPTSNVAFRSGNTSHG